MLYVFVVSSGTMKKFEMSLALKNVNELKGAIEKSLNIPVEDQVLLCSGGEELKANNRVGNYGAGTDTNPIFLFSKHTNEAGGPVSSHVRASSDLCIEDDVKGCCNMAPSSNAATVRSSLAQRFAELAVSECKECDDLVHSQHLQQQGWAAVIANLEDAKESLVKRKAHFDDIFQKYLKNRGAYQSVLETFPQDIELLAKVPLLPKLILGTEEDVDKEHTLLSWFCSEPRPALEALAEKCRKLLEELNEQSLSVLDEEVNSVLKMVDYPHFKEVKGIEGRLFTLNKLIEDARKYEKDQRDLANWFVQTQSRIHKDSSVLVDLCSTFQNQLELMLQNHAGLGEILQKCGKAKAELCDGIQTRLQFVCRLESQMYELQVRLAFHEKHVQSVSRQVDSFCQVHHAPKRYLRALHEVCRRRAFADAFLRWGAAVAHHALRAYDRETDLRRRFAADANIVDNLFPGMDDLPPPFAVECPQPFDMNLPPVVPEDLDLLKSCCPELADFCEVPPSKKLAVQEGSFPPSSPFEDPAKSEVDEFEKVDSVSKEDYQATEYFIDDSMPSSYTESNDTSPLMPKSHHVVVAELIKQIDQKNTSLLGAMSSVKSSHTLSTLQRFMDEQRAMAARVRSDLAGLKHYVADEWEKWINSHIVPLLNHFRDQMLLQKKEADELALQNVVQSEVDAQKLEDVENQVVRYEQHIRDLSSNLDEVQHAKEQAEAEMNLKRDLIRGMMLEHELELDLLRNEVAKEKDVEITTLNEVSVKMWRTRERSDIVPQFHVSKRCALEEELSTTQSALNEAREQLDACQVLLREKESLVERLQAEQEAMKGEMKEQKCKHANELESLRSRFRLAYSTSSLDKMSSDSSLENLSLERDMMEVCKHEKLLLEMRETCKKELEELQRKHQEQLDSLKSTYIAENQVSFNSAISRVAQEKDAYIGELHSQKSSLAAKMHTLQVLFTTYVEEHTEEALKALKVEFASEAKTKFNPICRECFNRISILSCSLNELVLLCYEQQYENFTVFCFGQHLHFLHNDSLEALDLKIPPGPTGKTWTIGVVTDKEFCQIKKATNRYKMARGTKFYRVKVKPWDASRSPLWHPRPQQEMSASAI